MLWHLRDLPFRRIKLHANWLELLSFSPVDTQRDLPIGWRPVNHVSFYNLIGPAHLPFQSKAQRQPFCVIYSVIDAAVYITSLLERWLDRTAVMLILEVVFQLTRLSLTARPAFD